MKLRETLKVWGERSRAATELPGEPQHKGIKCGEAAVNELPAYSSGTPAQRMSQSILKVVLIVNNALPPYESGTQL